MRKKDAIRLAVNIMDYMVEMGQYDYETQKEKLLAAREVLAEMLE